MSAVRNQFCTLPMFCKGPLWPWTYGSWFYNYLCNQCLSPLMLWVWISIRARCTTLCEKVCQWLATGQWFSPSPGTPPVSSTNKADHHNITEILLKVALNTIEQTNKQSKSVWFQFEEHSISRLLYCLLNYLKLVFWLNSNCTWLIIRWSLTKS